MRPTGPCSISSPIYARRRRPAPPKRPCRCAPSFSPILPICARRLDAAALRLLDRRRVDLRALVRALPGPENFLATPRQRLDRAGEKLRAGLAAGLSRRQLALANASRLLARHAPHAEAQRAIGRLNNLAFRLGAARAALVEKRRERLETLAARFSAARLANRTLLRNDLRAREERRRALAGRLDAAARALLARRREALGHVGQMLAAVGYQPVLRRGFALARDAAGAPIRSVVQAPDGARLTLQFADGKIAATAGPPLDAAPPKKRAVKSPKTKPGDQGSLF